MNKTYDINVIDSDSSPAWTRGPHIVSATPGNRDGGRCRYTVITSDAAALEDALDDDEQIIDYNDVTPAPTVHLDISDGSPSDCCDTAGAVDYDVTLTIDGVETQGGITLVPGEYDGQLSSWGELDHWVSSSLAEVIRTLTNSQRKIVLRAIEARDAGDVSLS